MNENKLKELYKSEINNSAPDFDKLWEKIDNSITPKTTEIPRISVTPKKPHKMWKTFAALAAGLALVAFIPALFSSYNITADVRTDSAAPSDKAGNSEQMQQNAVLSPEYADSSDAVADSAEISEPLNYNDLHFNSYSETILSCSGSPNGDDYFVEETVLSSADCIVSGTVKSVFLSDDGSSICYEFEAAESYPENVPETIIVESCSDYPMKRGREYLLPLEKSAENYRTVYDNIPQIEFTADGGIVYYNGWSSLDDSSSQSLIYPQRTVDDFFYDRMMFSYSGDYSALIRKFYDAKQL